VAVAELMKAVTGKCFVGSLFAPKQTMSGFRRQV